MGILDSISKNPSFLALAALGLGLLIFRDKISGFFSDISGGAEGAASVAALGGRAAEGINLQLDNLDNFFKGIEEFKFPTLEFPTIDFSNIFGGENGTATETPIDITETPAAEGRASDRGRITDVINSFLPLPILENTNVQTDIEGNTFQGGGISFIGGTVTETPIRFLSLSQIIDKFGVSASRAASLRAEAIGFSPEEESFLGIGLNPPSVSGGFEGLTSQEIALRLTGGNISNF